MANVVVENKPEEVKKEAEVTAGDQNSKNKKKKEKAKAKKEAEEKAKAEAEKKAEQDKANAPKAATEMTAEEKKAAVKAAMEKRGNITQPKTNKDDSVANQIKAEKDKRTGGKKQKVHGTELMY